MMPHQQSWANRYGWLLVLCVMLTGSWHSAVAYDAVDVTNGGSVTGVVNFAGTPPPPTPLEITRDEKACGTGTRPSDALVVSKSGRVQYTVISLENIKAGKPQPEVKENPTLVQEKCWFNPHILLVPAGSTVDLYNRDKAMHNIHTASKENPVINKAHPSFKKRLRFKLRKPEIIKIKCDMHKWMDGWFVVTEHPYNAVTDADGAFSLADVPAGTYTLKAWHETLGTQTQEITVKAGAETKVEFEMKQ